MGGDLLLDCPASPEEVYASAVARVRSRIVELIGEVHASIASAELGLALDDEGEYQTGRAAAISAIVEYGLKAIERGGEWGPIPAPLAEQVRHAARAGVRLGIVLRLYLAGHRRVMDFIRNEIRRGDNADHEPVLEHIGEKVRSLLDHIVVSVEHEYEDERALLACAPERRRERLVRRLLSEDLNAAELAELDYEVHFSSHLALIAFGSDGWEVARCLESANQLRVLSVTGDDGAVWVWVGGKDKVSIHAVKRLLAVSGCEKTPLAIGDPAGGLDGWRHTHEEARAAALIARHEQQGFTRCADVLPIVGALQDESIVRMYERTYLLPLNKLHKRGQPARKSLLAYFKHDRSASCAGEAIKVTPRTIQNHLNEARKVLEAPLNMTALELALRLEELGYVTEVGGARRHER
jgi:hypothetical protein